MLGKGVKCERRCNSIRVSHGFHLEPTSPQHVQILQQIEAPINSPDWQIIELINKTKLWTPAYGFPGTHPPVLPLEGQQVGLLLALLLLKPALPPLPGGVIGLGRAAGREAGRRVPAAGTHCCILRAAVARGACEQDGQKLQRI